MLRLLPLATRSLMRNRRRTLFTLTAIGVGVGVVVFGQAFGQGLLNTMVQMTALSRTGAIQVHAAGYARSTDTSPLTLDLPAEGELLARIRAVPGVKAVSRRIRFGGMVSNGSRSTMVMATAYQPEEEFLVCPDRVKEVPPEGGHHLQGGPPNAAVLGAELARSFNTHPGDTLVLTAAGQKGSINALDVEMVGRTLGAVPMESKRTLTLPLAHAQELLGMEGRVTQYAVAVDSLREIDEVAARLKSALGDRYEVTTWEEAVPFVQVMVSRLRVILRMISVVLFILVVFGVVNTMLMSVYERVREIGTMLAVGLRRRRVLQLFLVEAAVLGLLGGVLGALGGAGVALVAAARGIELTPPGSVVQQLVRPELSAQVMVLTLLGTLAGAVLAAAWPARKASLMNPVDALRTN